MSTTPNEPEKAISDAVQPAGERAATAGESAGPAETARSETPGGSPRHAAGSEAAAALHMADGLGDGSPRYGETAGEVPPSGSEESWSAGHPGLVVDHDHGISGKRFAAGVLIGAIALTGGVFAGYSLLTAKSPNGNGGAAWTAAVTSDGAVVQGINAQNDVGPHAALLGAVGQQVRDAAAVCATATADSSRLTATTGTVATLGGWAALAAPTVEEIKGEAVKLNEAVVANDKAGIADAAKSLCTSFGKTVALPALPDPAASQAWAAGITAYAAAANNALKGAAGDKNALAQAEKDLANGKAQLDAMSARINAA